ncbi:MAG TPA: NAD(P)(+) transhydrogenase (Re/Si-specific) subunit beta [Acidimicrobiia bacterium]|nr:NAD(P)(+) transhydrogenase (Re/Si-specific) subunit beta [Acidimicrobiia bacterium]
MSDAARDLVYLAAAAAFIVGLKRLGSPRTARSGNLIASGAMLVAVVVTLLDLEILEWWALIAGLALGGAIGALLATRVQMTAMPQLVAAFNGFGGAASALVAGAEFIRLEDVTLPVETILTMILSVVIGSITLTGSFVAYAKLQGLISGSPVTYPGMRIVNGVLFGGAIVLIVWAQATQDGLAFWLAGGAALVLGVLAVNPIGGADMPVVIALLNSLSGIAAAMTGFVITNSALVISGALVGASGLILTKLMTEAMNRSLGNVLFGAFGAGSGGGPVESSEHGDATSTSADDVAIALTYAQQVVVVPGYGLAVAQAQHALRELMEELERRGVSVAYGIHPVAGRMPGHMNVLLAEADVPYDQLLDLDQTNAILPRTDVVLVIGANDVVNPSARDDSSSPIFGMPILEVDHAATVVVIKRSLSPGFAGLDNPLFYMDRTKMLFADAKKAMTDLVAAIERV